MSSDNVPLQGEEQRLREEIQKLLTELRAKLAHGDDLGNDQISLLGKKAYQLHHSLEKHGTPVKHHKYMLENRGLFAESKEFYNHIHPVEDLLAFIDNVNANDDPVDTTLGIPIRVGIYSRRWEHEDAYWFTRNASGWHIRKLEQEISTGPDGRIGGPHGSGLFSLLNQENINYPEGLPGYLEWLWYQAAKYGLTEQKLKAALEELATWVNIVEKASPKTVFEGYK